MSDISGIGYGSDHNWERGETNQNPMGWSDKFTRYHCKCGATFNHHYDVTPNIFEAIKQARVPEKCKKEKK